MISFTHLAFAFALVYLLRFPVVYGMFGGLLPDVDILFEFGFPLTHRGLMHSPLAAAAFATGLYLIDGRKSPALALATGYISHLFIDTFTYSGIMWLYPLEKDFSFGFIGYSDLFTNISIIVLSLLIPVLWGNRHRVRRWMR